MSRTLAKIYELNYTLSSADFKNINNSTLKSILSGSISTFTNRIIMPLSPPIISINYNSVAYATSTGNLVVTFANTASNYIYTVPSSFLTTTASQKRTFALNNVSNVEMFVANSDIVIGLDSATKYTAGDSTFNIYLHFSVIES